MKVVYKQDIFDNDKEKYQYLICAGASILLLFYSMLLI